MAELDGSILVVHPDRKSQRLIQRMLGSAGRAVVIVDWLEPAQLALKDGTPALMIIASSVRVAPGCDALVDAAIAGGCSACVVIHEDRVAPPAHLFEVTSFLHLVTAQWPVLAEELVITTQKLLRGDILGFDKYLAWGSVTGSTEVVSAEDRLRALSELQTHTERMQLGRRQQAAIMLAADELVLNAVHNAPVDDEGMRYLRELPRDIQRPLVGREQPRLSWGCDGRWFAIAVTDRFGSLEPSAVVRYLGKSLAQSGQVRSEGAGAGIGLAMTYASVNQLVFNIDPGRTTEAIALVDVRPWPPASMPTLASFHLFFTAPAA